MQGALSTLEYLREDCINCSFLDAWYYALKSSCILSLSSKNVFMFEIMINAFLGPSIQVAI